VSFEEESANSIAVNTMTHLLANNSLAASSKHACMKLFLRIFKCKDMTVLTHVHKEVVRMMSMLHWPKCVQQTSRRLPKPSRRRTFSI